MTSVPLLVTVLLSQTAPQKTSPIAVVIVSKRAGAESAAKKMADRTVLALRKEMLEVLDDAQSVKALKAAGFSDPRKCQAIRSCLSKLAFLLGPDALVIGVDVGKVASTHAVHLEATTARGAEPLKIAEFDVEGTDWKDAALQPLTDFAHGLAAQLNPPPPPAPAPEVVAAPPVEPAPKPIVLEPKPAAAPPAPEVVAAPEPQPKLAAFVTGGSAVAAFVVSGVLLGMGMSDKATLDGARSMENGLVTSSLTQSQIDALASSGNAKLTASLVSLLIGVGLAAVSLVLFLQE